MHLISTCLVLSKVNFSRSPSHSLLSLVYFEFYHRLGFILYLAPIASRWFVNCSRFLNVNSVFSFFIFSVPFLLRSIYNAIWWSFIVICDGICCQIEMWVFVRNDWENFQMDQHLLGGKYTTQVMIVREKRMIDS